MNLAYRTYRIVPTLAAIALFLLTGSLLVGLFQSKPEAMNPEDEMQAVYFAFHNAGSIPETVDVPVLRRLLGQLDPALASIADRVTVVSYTRDKNGFELRVRHLGQPDRIHTIASYGYR